MDALMPMSVNLIPLVSALIITVAVTVILLFLPAAIELKKPRDAGPRKITPNTPRLSVISGAVQSEGKPGDYSVAGAISVLPNIEKF
jgi:hypothetical protein